MILGPLRDALREMGSASERWIFGLLLLFVASIPFSIFLAQVGYFGALIIWLVLVGLKKAPLPRRTGLEVFFVLFLAIEFISAMFSTNTAQALLYMQRRVLLLPVIYVMVASVRSAAALRAMLTVFLISVLLVALWSFRDVVTNLSSYLAFERRLSEFQMYMTAGGIMMIAAILLIPFALHSKTPLTVRVWTLAALVPVLANLLFTFTRSSWLGLIAGMLVIGLRRFRGSLIPFVILLGGVALFSSPEMQERMTSAFDPSHPNNVTRLHMWEVGWGMFRDHPLIGIGDIGTEQLWDRYSEPGWQPEGHLHNNIVMWAVTLGIVGAATLIGLFVVLWIRLWRIERTLKEHWLTGSLLLGSLGMMAGFQVNGLFEWNFGDAEIMMLVWTITGLSLAAERWLAPTGGR